MESAPKDRREEEEEEEGKEEEEVGRSYSQGIVACAYKNSKIGAGMHAHEEKERGEGRGREGGRERLHKHCLWRW